MSLIIKICNFKINGFLQKIYFQDKTPRWQGDNYGFSRPRTAECFRLVCRPKKKKGLFGSKYKLVSSKQFELANRDLDIDINFSGYITIGKQGKGWDGDKWYKQDKNKKHDSKKE